MFTSKYKYRSEKFTRDVEHPIPDNTRLTLIEIEVPTKAKMRVLSIGVYTNSTEFYIGNVLWFEVSIDNAPLDPTFRLGRILGPISPGGGGAWEGGSIRFDSRMRQAVHGVEIAGGHKFRVDALNSLVPPAGDGPSPWMGVSLEWEFLYEECEGLDVTVEGSIPGSGLLGKGC